MRHVSKALWLIVVQLLVLAVGLALIASIASAQTPYRDLTKRLLTFYPSRGVAMTDTVLTTDSVQIVIPRTRWMSDAGGDQIRFYNDAYFATGDTASHYVDAIDDATAAHSWGLWDAPTGVYSAYEIAGGADTAIAGLQHVPILGNEAPEDFIYSGEAIYDSAVVTVARVNTEVLAPKSGHRIDTPGATSFAVDSLLGYSGLQIHMPDGLVFFGSATIPGVVSYADGAGHWYQTQLNRELAGNAAWYLPEPMTVAFDDATPPYRQAFYVKDAYSGWVGIAQAQDSWVRVRVTGTTDSLVVEAEEALTGTVVIFPWEE